MYFENQILHPGEKIKKLRIMLHAAQKELSSKSISRNFISAIENKREALSVNAAKVIAYNLNRIIDEGAYTLPHITPEELLLSEEEQAIIIVKNRIKELGKYEDDSIEQFKLKVNNIESLIESYNIPEDVLYDFYKIVIDFYYKNYCYEMAEVYILEKLDLSSIQQNEIEYIESLLVKMKICIKLNKNASIVHIGEYILKFINRHKINDEVYKKRTYFNVALSCKKLNESKEGLYYINKLKSSDFQFTESELSDITLLEGILYRQNGNYEIAEIKLREYLELSKKMKCNRNIVLGYNDLAYYYRSLKDYGRAKFNIDRAIYISENNNIDSELLTIVFHEAFCIYMKFDEELMLHYFNKTLDKGILTGNTELLLDAINRIFDYFEGKGTKDKNLEILKNIDDKTKNYDKKNELGEVYVRAFNYVDF